jgi:hypothetical protein
MKKFYSQPWLLIELCSFLEEVSELMLFPVSVLRCVSFYSLAVKSSDEFNFIIQNNLNLEKVQKVKFLNQSVNAELGLLIAKNFPSLKHLELEEPYSLEKLRHFLHFLNKSHKDHQVKIQTKNPQIPWFLRRKTSNLILSS